MTSPKLDRHEPRELLDVLWERVRSSFHEADTEFEAAVKAWIAERKRQMEQGK